MLKALELVGFKSFADKTRLEFPPGITVVVGPNGSGKSNIVDAIKWVLGEQSVKSLRGKEMVDVIFNGSSHRRPLNTAETTLTFDNTARLLALDADEVSITRRVYRSGEGEYLVNGQAGRLRDIRDLFAGTGVASGSYGIIEQGKVDVLLQSSPRDRRLIFEEAAGISRFKTKKLEAQRRFERIEQNLLRLSDIVEEVENRLRTVRLQAAKARKYKEHADRLQELRTQVGLADWRALTSALEAIERELTALGDEIGGLTAQAERLEAQALAIDVELADSDDAIRSNEARIAQNRERIAAYEATIEHERRLSEELEEEVKRYRRQLTAMSLRAGNLDEQLLATGQALAAVEAEHREVAHRVGEEERGLTRLTAELDELRAQNEQRRSAHLDLMRKAAGLGKQISALESQVAAAQSICQRGDARRDELQRLRQVLETELIERRQRLADLTAAHQQREQTLESLRLQQGERRRRCAQAQQELSTARERHSGASERAALLEELERRLEGVSSGVKELLVKAREAADGPHRHIRGLVADLLHVHMDSAPVIEAALGELAQYLVVASSAELVEHMQQEAGRPAGRVGLVRLDVLPTLTGAEQLDLSGEPGVIGRADQFVETAPDAAVLARRLLGKTWLVETLADGLSLSKSLGRGLTFVTRSSEVVAPDGTLLLGPRQAATGLISRRSELRALRQQVAELAAKIERGRVELVECETQIGQGDQQLSVLAAEHRQLSDQLAAEQLLAAAAEERGVQLDRQAQTIEAELRAAAAQHATAAEALAAARGQLVELEANLADFDGRLRDGLHRAAELDQARQRFGRENNAARVELAKSEQRLDHLRTQKQQLERDQQERARALVEGRGQLQLAGQRARQAARNILTAESALAELFLRKEALSAANAVKLARREQGRSQKNEMMEESQRLRARTRKLEGKLHAKDLAAGNVRHERTTLADRLREDYAIDLASLQNDASMSLTAAELQARQAMDAEIADLRAKINSIGGVNLDALGELDELETRFQLLSSQQTDLVTAKNSLEQIIGKINADSRRLFVEMLDVVREHFQTLFRKLFGGGQAEIVLDSEEDILECGVEIVARPPGKEPRNISLLSGGERTLTCVALLLAIFRSRPSPFCVLDEVDAALDEANIERFVGVLKEFLTWTQFIVVTHSKKTMTCAGTLYGITMQESGVSKRVSVRFEDVSENGEFTHYEEVPPEPRAADEQAA